MRNISNYFVWPFDYIPVGRPQTLRFFEDHDGRLAQAVTDGEPFAAQVAPTHTAFEKLRDSLGATEATFAEQQGATITVDDMIDEFKTAVVDGEITVLGKFKKTSAQYQRFYPHGLTQYSNTNKGTATTLMIQYKKAAFDYKADLGQPFSDQFELIYTNYLAVRNGQILLKESTSAKRSDWDVNLDAMKDQAFDNILAIARANRGKPQVARRYFTQSILRGRKIKKSDGTEVEAYKLTVPKAGRAVADISFSVDDTLLLYISGQVGLRYFGAATPDAEMPVESPMVPSDDEVEVTALALGAPDNKYLIFVNEDPNIDGDVEITLL
jgi:hypothetical protein